MDSNATFFTRDRNFYKNLFRMLIIVSLQNVIAYSVNMADNMMLGAYSQDALAGAATVNQIYFLVQQISLALGDSLIVLSSQYWGEKRVAPIRSVMKEAFKWSAIIGIPIFAVISIFPVQILELFTKDAAIISEGAAYLSIVRWSFLLFMITNILIFALRSVGTVRIAFYMASISLVINVGINYLLIFGKGNMPEMGVRGAAIGTCIARGIELSVVLFYLIFVDRKLQVRKKVRISSEKELKKDEILHVKKNYNKIFIAVFFSQILWAVSVPMQTAILGHLSSNAIAANSVATTFYQYLKVVVVALSSVSSVMIGISIGTGNMARVKSDARTLQVLDVMIGLVLGVLLFISRGFILSFYSLNSEAMILADQLMVIMAFIMVGMSYQMPVSMGIIRGGGDAKFTLIMNLISVWGIVMPLSFLTAFYWHMPIAIVVIALQSDQIFKCIPTSLRVRTYKWVTVLTKK
ncbi:MAG: MATE family efflux transporter [Lachnospiraceae bacterium]